MQLCRVRCCAVPSGTDVCAERINKPPFSSLTLSCGSVNHTVICESPAIQPTLNTYDMHHMISSGQVYCLSCLADMEEDCVQGAGRLLLITFLISTHEHLQKFDKRYSLHRRIMLRK